MIEMKIKFRKDHKGKSMKKDDTLENELLLTSRRSHRMEQMLFMVVVIIAMGVVAFNFWMYILNP
jgi:hypothetical protein